MDKDYKLKNNIPYIFVGIIILIIPIIFDILFDFGVYNKLVLILCTIISTLVFQNSNRLVKFFQLQLGDKAKIEDKGTIVIKDKDGNILRQTNF